MALKLNNVIPYAIQYNGKELTDIYLNDDTKIWYSCFSYSLQDDNTYSVKARDGVQILDTLIIPSKYDNKLVTAIGSDANNEGFKGVDGFEGCTSLKNITIPNSVTDIVNEAFMDCSNLSSVTLSNNITEIENRLFALCSSLESIAIPEGVTTIGENAFWNCTQLKNITFGENSSLTSIGNGAFIALPLENFVIPDGVEVIGEQAFYNCSNLTKVVIPNSVTSIGKAVFDSCSSLTQVFYKGTFDEWSNINIDSNNEGLAKATRYYYYETEPADVGNYWHYVDGEPTIWECSNASLENYFTFTLLEDGNYSIKAKDKNKLPSEIVIPSKYNGKAITTIDTSAFDGCSSLTSVVIPDSITSINYRAFTNCSKLTGINIPNSVTSIGQYAFWYCSKLTSINIPDSVTSISSDAFRDCKSLTNVVIGDGVTSIGYAAFSGCSSLTSVVIGNSVTSIGNRAFYNCSSLQSVTIPDSVTSIYGYTFYNCSSLTRVVIGDGVTSIGERAFMKCFELAQVVIGANVNEIKSLAFYGCTKLDKVFYKGTTQESWNNIDIYRYKVSGYTEYSNYSNEELITAARYYYSEAEPLKDGDYWHYVKDSVIIWGSYNATPDGYFTFIRYSGHEGYSVKIKDTSYVPDELAIPSMYNGVAVTEIEEEGFKDCATLVKITIPDSVTSIGNSAFKGCENLNSVVFGTNSCLTSIGDYAFDGCDNLNVTLPDSVNYIGNSAFWGCNSINIPKSLTDIGYGAFAGCQNIVNATIPNSVITIGERAFAYCDFGKITIPDSVTSIGKNAFYFCSSLVSVVIPDSVTSIGEGAFDYCKFFTSVYYNGTAAEWNSISIHSSNDYLKNATRYYYSETHPTAAGNYWHRVGKVLTVWCNNFEIVTDVAVAPTCTANGFTEGSHCSVCGEIFVAQEIIPALSHTDGEVVIENKKPPTCTEVGSYDNVVYCVVCNEELFRETVTIDALGHTVVTDVAVAPTCTANGFTEGSHCSVCGEIIVAQKIIPATGHNFVDGKCEVCGAQAASSEYFEFKYKKYDDTYSIVGYKETMPNEVIIPSEYMGKTVTAIDSEAFSGCINLISVVIPDSVTYIGSNAFRDCSSLTSVVIPNNVTYISSEAFYNCSSLTSVVIPNNVTSIGYSAFRDCSSLTSVVIPNNVTSIGYSAFEGCSSLTSITIPNSVTSIGTSAFNGCSSLTSIVIPDSVTFIGNYTFGNCSSLKSAIIPNSIIEISPSMFSHCSSLTSVVIPDSVTSIGSGAFYNCSSLTSVVIGDSVTSIGSQAFSWCNSLNSVYITDVANWCNIAFENNLSHPLNCLGGNLYLNNEPVTELVIPEGVTTINNFTFMHCTSLTSVVIPDSVTSIGERAFWGCSSLTSITIPNSVTSIGDAAFNDCSSLASVTIGNSVTSIGNSAFCYCDNLTSITIPNSVTFIGNYAFCECYSLTSVVIPDSVTSIGEGAFQYCYKLLITVDKDNISYYVQDGCLIEKETSKIIFANAKAVIPSSVTAIGSGAFGGDTYFAPIKITKSITAIESLAFQKCENLAVYVEYKEDEIPEGWAEDWHDGSIDVKWGSLGTNDFIYTYQPDTDTYSVKVGEKASGDVVIPSEYDGKVVTAIDDNAFENRCDITSITIPDSIKTIGHRAFKNCSSLQELTIPDSVEYIGHQTLNGCSNIVSIVLPYIGNFDWKDENHFYEYPLGYHFGTEEYVGGVATEQEYYNYWDINDPGTLLETRTFYIPEGLRTVEVHRGNILHGAFQNCKGITKITLPTEIDKIGKNSFLKCENLEELIIPVTLKEIDYSAFEGCSKVIIQYYGDTTKYRIENNCLIEVESNEVIFGNQNSEIPSSASSIGTGAFYGNTYFAPIKIPLSVTNIGSQAFGGKGVIIHVEAARKPIGWANDWCDSSAKVIWGYNCVRGHSYSSIVKPPTCIAQGYTTHICSDCGFTYKKDFIDALNHIYRTMIVDPTCTEQGYISYTCARCGDAYQDNFTEALGHAWIDATCTEPKTCSRCGVTEGEPLGHSYGAWLTTVAPTCTKFGTMERTCSRCGDVDVSTIEPLGHNWIDATCDAPKTCSRCGETIGEALPHVWGEWISNDDRTHSRVCVNDATHIETELCSYSKVVTPPTCTEQGYTTYTCTVCGHVYEGDYTAKLGHNYVEIVTPPTCTEDGYSTYTCTVCGNSYIADPEPALGHSASDWIIDVRPTGLTAGSKHKECTRCGEILETATIPKLEDADEYLTYTLLDSGDGYSVKATYLDYLPSELTIPSTFNGKSVIVVEFEAFAGYRDSNAVVAPLTKVTLPDSIEAILSDAFRGCANLIEINIPIGVEYIGLDAFDGCDNLTIYCETSSKPDIWDDDWNSSNCNVVWGCGDTYLTTEDGNILTDENKNLLIL